MRYKLLGKSGLRVSELCLGAMTFGEDWGWGASKDESRQMFETFVDAGGNFIDTANVYTDGSSEKIVGELIAPDRERFVVATKYSLSSRLNSTGSDPNDSGNHRKNLMQSLERSLKRLNTDYVDLLWLHVWDFTTPIEEIMRALDDLVRQGKVMYVGISDTPAWIVSQANMLAQCRGWTPFVALQILYNLIDRTAERDLLPMAQALEMTVTPWSPLARGVLTGKYNHNGNGQSNSRGENIPERSLKIAEVVGQVAQELGYSPSQVALAWIRAQSSAAIPIIGARSLSHVKDNLACVDIVLPPEHLKRLDEVSQIELGFPHDFINSDTGHDRFFGSIYKAIDNPRKLMTYNA
ncbi:MAG: aldo/keto reductase [Nostoc sp.]|uniref:aldo/keto reductase n=1 Tax=Nostoc sp. TaxID=1180 RepID=UPI002FF9493E